MGGYNAIDKLVPRLVWAVEELYAMGKEAEAEDVEEAIAVLEGRLVLKPDGTVGLPDRETADE